jgi:hypothetical protein
VRFTLFIIILYATYLLATYRRGSILIWSIWDRVYNRITKWNVRPKIPPSCGHSEALGRVSCTKNGFFSIYIFIIYLKYKGIRWKMQMELQGMISTRLCRCTTSRTRTSPHSKPLLHRAMQKVSFSFYSCSCLYSYFYLFLYEQLSSFYNYIIT